MARRSGAALGPESGAVWPGRHAAPAWFPRTRRTRVRRRPLSSGEGRPGGRGASGGGQCPPWWRHWVLSSDPARCEGVEAALRGPGTPATPARAAIGRPSRPPRLPRPSHPPLTRLGSLSLSLFPPPPPPPGQHPQDQEGLLQGQGVRQAPAAQGCVWRNGRERRVAVGSRPSSKTTPPLFPSHALFPCPSLPLLLPPPHSHPVQDGQGLPVRAGCVKNEGRERGGHARPPAACVEEAHPLPLPLTTHPRSHGLPFFSLFSLPFR